MHCSSPTSISTYLITTVLYTSIGLLPNKVQLTQHLIKSLKLPESRLSPCANRSGVPTSTSLP